MILPRYYINEKTLVTILIAISSLNYDLRKIILTKLVEEIAEDEFMKEFPIENILFGYDDVTVYMDTSDYYFSE